MIKKHKLSIPILCDQDNIIAAQFGLVFTIPEDLREVYLSFGIDLERHNGNASWTLPVPARYIINQSGVVHDVEVHLDYTQRSEPQETLKNLASVIK